MGYIFLPAIPPILNIIVPLNESRGRELIYPAYYFVDEERYYYPIITHMAVAVIVLNVVYMACDINLIYIIHHACSLLTISGWVRVRFLLFFLHLENRVTDIDKTKREVFRLAFIFDSGEMKTKYKGNRENACSDFEKLAPIALFQ